MASVKKRPDGKWRARYVDPEGKERAQHFTTKADAEAWLAAQVTRLRDGTWVDPRLGKRTFGEYAATWIAGQVHHRKSTADITRWRLEKHLLPTFEKRPLAAITRSEVQAWVSSLKLAPSTVETCYRLLAQIMLAAVEDRVLGHTPCRRVNLPRRETGALVIPTTEQLGALHAAASDRGKALVLFGAGTGMRVSEVCGLTTDRVDFLRRIVTVDRQLINQAGGVPRFGPPKTKASTRTIPIPQDLVEVLSAHLASWPSPDTVFRTGTRNTPWTRKSLGGEFARWCGSAGLEGFTWHSLRHYYASCLINSGQSVKVVQARLGHATAGETLDTYGHLWPSDEDGTRDAVSGVLGEISRTSDGLTARKSRSAG